MEWKLNTEEARIIGALMEKQLATPEYYPLSLNALVQACNQKSSRNPVVNYSEDLVSNCIKRLYDRALVSYITSQDRRVPRYDQRLSKLLNCSIEQTAILCVLFLRGPQTPGEIKGRTGRLFPFASLEDVMSELETMEAREEFSLVYQLPKQPGTKENRYMHHFFEQESFQILEKECVANVPESSGLEQEIMELKDQLQQLRKEFETFRDQFS